MSMGLLSVTHLTGESLLMIDKWLYQLYKRRTGYALLTHYLQMPGLIFIIITGASTPVLLYSSIGNDMWENCRTSY